MSSLVWIRVGDIRMSLFYFNVYLSLNMCVCVTHTHIYIYADMCMYLTPEEHGFELHRSTYQRFFSINVIQHCKCIFYSL